MDPCRKPAVLLNTSALNSLSSGGGSTSALAPLTASGRTSVLARTAPAARAHPREPVGRLTTAISLESRSRAAAPGRGWCGRTSSGRASPPAPAQNSATPTEHTDSVCYVTLRFERMRSVKTPQRAGAPSRLAGGPCSSGWCGSAHLGEGGDALRAGGGADRAADAERVGPVAVPVTDVHLVAEAAEGEHAVRVPATQGVGHVVRATALEGEGVDAVAVPVTGEGDVRGAAVGEDHVGVAADDRVLHVVGRATADGEGVVAVAVPVADEHLVVRTAVGEAHVGRSTPEGVLDVVLRPAAHGEGVAAVAVPVTREDDVTG